MILDALGKPDSLKCEPKINKDACSTGIRVCCICVQEYRAQRLQGSLGTTLVSVHVVGVGDTTWQIGGVEEQTSPIHRHGTDLC